jgi:hypothetical protein
LYASLEEFTPMIKRGEADFFFLANDPTEALLSHLVAKGYPHLVNHNPKRTEEELFKLGYGAPEYIARVYRGWNEAIRAAKGEIVVLVNSDNFFSPDWLENLLKYVSPRTIVSSKLVERAHPQHGVFKGAYHGEFGSHPAKFKKDDFLRFCDLMRITGTERGGAYMPCAFFKNQALRVGLYPEGNLAGASFHQIVAYGDQVFFRKLSKIGVNHVTALDSICYHIKEGEMDESKSPSNVPNMLTSVPETRPGRRRLPMNVAVTSYGGHRYLAAKRSLPRWAREGVEWMRKPDSRHAKRLIRKVMPERLYRVVRSVSHRAKGQ